MRDLRSADVAARRAFGRRWFLAAAAACVALPARAAAKTVLVLADRDNPRHDTIVGAFRPACADVDQIVYTLDASTDAAAFLADGIRDLPVDAVLAVGDRALVAAVREFPGASVVFVDASDPSPGLTAGAVGVSTRVGADAGLTRLRAALPRVERYGLIRSSADTDDAWWAALDAAAERLAVQVEVRRVGAASEVVNAVTALLARAQALWILPDRAVWTGTAVARTLTEATAAKVAVVGPDRSWLTAARPAPLVIETSAVALGTAAAARVRASLGLGSPTSSDADPWLVGVQVAWRGLGLLLNKDIAAHVDEWLDAR
jgi:ABC-type uncharacterized transport system substrate-binding protein